MAELTVEQQERADREAQAWAKLLHRAEAQGVSIEYAHPDRVELSLRDFEFLLARAEEAEFEGKV